MLPSYFERDFAVQQAAGFLPPEEWIKKPIWGREGNGIQVVDEAGRLVSEKYVPNADEFGNELERYLNDYEAVKHKIAAAEQMIRPELKDAFFAAFL